MSTYERVILGLTHVLGLVAAGILVAALVFTAFAFPRAGNTRVSFNETRDFLARLEAGESDELTEDIVPTMELPPELNENVSPEAMQTVVELAGGLQPEAAEELLADVGGIAEDAVEEYGDSPETRLQVDETAVAAAQLKFLKFQQAEQNLLERRRHTVMLFGQLGLLGLFGLLLAVLAVERNTRRLRTAPSE